MALYNCDKNIVGAKVKSIFELNILMLYILTIQKVYSDVKGKSRVIIPRDFIKSINRIVLDIDLNGYNYEQKPPKK